MNGSNVTIPAGTERIIVGVDGSPGSRAALRWAFGLAARTGQALTAIMAWDSPTTYGTAWHVPDWERQCAGLLQESLRATLDQEHRVEVTTTVAAGHAADVLLAAAADAAMLVIGGRGTGGFREMRMGSVCRHVVAWAPCPVVVVPAPDGQEPPLPAHLTTLAWS